MQSILGNTRKTDITFRADGRIDIAARVASLLSLHKGDVIDVLDGGGELYLYVKLHAPTVGRHEAACFPTHARSRHFRASRIFSARFPASLSSPLSIRQTPPSSRRQTPIFAGDSIYHDRSPA